MTTLTGDNARIAQWAIGMTGAELGVVARVPLSGSDAVAIINAADLPLVTAYTWHLTTKGYAATNRRIGGMQHHVFMHRLILQPGEGLTVDHANRDKLDNRRCNLRVANFAQQQANQGLTARNKSGFRGVSWFKTRSKWRAVIQIDGRFKHLGYFPTAEMAAHAYDVAALDHFGQFAYQNFPREAA